MICLGARGLCLILSAPDEICSKASIPIWREESVAIRLDMLASRLGISVACASRV